MTTTDWQFQLGDVVFGDGTDYLVYQFMRSGPKLRRADAPIPRAHGIRHGRTYADGRICSIEFEVDGATPSLAFENLGALEKAWFDYSINLDTGQVGYLTYKRPGAAARRLFGRPDPEKFTQGSLENAHVGLIPVTAEFETSDHLSYQDEEFNHTIGFVPAASGGFNFPLSFPLMTAEEGNTLAQLNIDGDAPTWITMRVYGPITNPVVDVVDFWQVSLNTTLTEGQYVDIDPRPWVREVRRNDGASLAGAFTSSSQRMSSMQLQPGTHNFVLRGTSPSGTASLNLRWRPAYYGL